MVEISFGSMIWFTCFAVSSICGLLVVLPSITPRVFHDFFIFGKSRQRERWKFRQDQFFLLPKRWFCHFYAIGILNTIFWVSVLVKSFKAEEIPYIAELILQIIRYPYIQGSADMLHCCIVMTCIAIQVTRRFLECVTLSVYSKDGKMSVAIYVIGLGFYTGLPLSCVAGSNLSQNVDFSDIYAHVGVLQILGISLFIFASVVQHQTARIFTNLRCDKTGKITNDKHHIPRGGMFVYVSSPHYFAEILIYISMATIFGFQNSMMNCVSLFVFSNQFSTAYYNHEWYIETFKDYPRNRRVLIPFIY